MKEEMLMSEQERDAIRLFRLMISEFMVAEYGPYRTLEGNIEFEFEWPQDNYRDLSVAIAGVSAHVQRETGIFIHTH